MLQRPGGAPRARNSSASQAGRPGAFTSSGLASDGALTTRQRIRAPLRFACPPRRTSQQGVPLFSEATASRRVAVKSSSLGSPQISPMTQERAEHLTPSSIAHSASFASRASTWMRSCVGRPGGWTRPLSRIAMRSCTQSSGFSVLTCARRNPAQPASRGWTENSSDKVGLAGWGRVHRPPKSFGVGRFLTARLVPAATRDRPLATRLATLVFYFCSYSRDSGWRVKPATRSDQAFRVLACCARLAATIGCRPGAWPSTSVRKARISATTRLITSRSMAKPVW